MPNVAPSTPKRRAALVKAETQPDDVTLYLGQAVDGRVELAEREGPGYLVLEGGLVGAHHVAQGRGGVAVSGWSRLATTRGSRT